MIVDDETFSGTWPFAARFYEGAGFRMHYIDEGAGDPILCLHGEPTWGYLFRLIVPELFKRHRVIVPDYMGFGKSETPSHLPYTTQRHIENLESLVLQMDLQNITLVLHDWGGVIGGALAARHPNRIARIVVTNTVFGFGTALEAELLEKNVHSSRYFQWMMRLHDEGKLETVLGEFGTIILSVMRQLQGFQASHRIDEHWLTAYSAPFATPDECLGAIAFPRSVVTGQVGFEIPSPTVASALKAKPAMMIYGMQDRVLQAPYFIPLFEESFPGAPIHRLENAGHFLFEDEPELIAKLIGDFVEA